MVERLELNKIPDVNRIHLLMMRKIPVVIKNMKDSVEYASSPTSCAWRFIVASAYAGQAREFMVADCHRIV